MLGKLYEHQDCSMARALETIGERWTLMIIRDAFYGVRRFSDFQGHLDIPRAVLSARLTGLVNDGILARRPDPEHAGRHLYELSAAGRDLWPVIYALLMWGGRHRASNSREFTHAECGTKLDERGSCRTCETTPNPEDILTIPLPGRGRRCDDPVTIVLRRPHRLLEPIVTSGSAGPSGPAAEPAV